jgi:hypothetical protein
MKLDDIQQRMSQFYATLDLKCEIPEGQVKEGITDYLEKVFQGEKNFWASADRFQGLRGKYTSENELIEKVAALLREDARNFLVLAHLHRQLRFTNLELIHFFFDRERLDDVGYYSKLLKLDNIFKSQFEKIASSASWTSYVGTVDFETINGEALLSSLKKTVTGYLGSEKGCWTLWKARIENDPSVSLRIAEFVIRNEDLRKVIETSTLKTSLERSLRTVNVEHVKRERGEYGGSRVKESLESCGFVFEQYTKLRDIEDLERSLKTQSPLSKPSEYIYTTEKLWKKEDKRFDFVLVSKKNIQFVIETNYFTTSMSKIREVVRHFMELKRACRGKYRLIYITDGIGWFSLAKDVKKMLEFETEEQKAESSPSPFLMTLEMFNRNMNKIKSAMS